MAKEPSVPLDLTGYTCFSAINCPVEQALQLVKEYGGLCALEHPREFAFSLAALPEAPAWTAVRWPRPGQFYDLMNLTMWLMGYKAGLGGENPIFAAFPPKERAGEGPLLARPDYDNPFGDSMTGYWQSWRFVYSMPEEKLEWIASNARPDLLLQTRHQAPLDLQLEWLEHPERVPAWTECSIQMEDPSVLKGN